MQQIMRIDAEKKSREQNDLKNHFVTAPMPKLIPFGVGFGDFCINLLL